MENERKGKAIERGWRTDILCGTHFAFERFLPESRTDRCILITDQNVERLYAAPLRELSIPILSIEPGESGKSHKVKEELEAALFKRGASKDTLIIGMGGGVVSDVSGYLAATFCRGCDHIQIPTSLTGMVDAAIGGKTGLNTPYGKNTVGAFHFPQKVAIDGAFLTTLPDEEWKNGLVELIKTGLVASPPLLLSLFDGAPSWHKKDLPLIMDTIFSCASIKAQIVERDPFEKEGYRRILNAGHTVGHSLERIFAYRLPHGTAVAIGLLVEGHIAHAMGLIERQVLETIDELFAFYDIPHLLPKPVLVEELLVALSTDKKGQKGTPRFSLLSSLGQVAPFGGEYCTPVENSVLTDAITWMNETCTESPCLNL